MIILGTAIIVAIITLILLIRWWNWEDIPVPLCVVTWILVLLSWGTTIIGGGCVIGISVSADVIREELVQDYEYYTYALENSIYENDNDLGKKELLDEIRDYNKDLYKNKKWEKNAWVGVWYPDIYSDLNYIEFK